MVGEIMPWKTPTRLLLTKNQSSEWEFARWKLGWSVGSGVSWRELALSQFFNGEHI